MDLIAREEQYGELEDADPKDEFFHVKFKRNDGFQEAFNCKMTGLETSKLQSCEDKCFETFRKNKFTEEFFIFLLEEAIKKSQKSH